MIDLFQVAADLQGFLLGREWKFCFIGGLALQRWGEPRVTQDVDCTLLTGFGGELPFVGDRRRHRPCRAAVRGHGC